MTLLQIRGLEAQLQRRDARIAALEAELAAIGAGGVNGPLLGASLAASAGSEPVAYCFAEELQSATENGDVFDAWTRESTGAMPLYAHPSPPEGVAGWKLVPIALTADMRHAARINGLDEETLVAMWHYLLATAPQTYAEPLQVFESPRAKTLMRAWEEGWAACRDAEFLGKKAQNNAFNQSTTVNQCVAEDMLHQDHPGASHGQAPARAAPTWDALHYAWRKIGCDVVGLDWGAFTNAAHYAPAPTPQAAQQAPAGANLFDEQGFRDWVLRNLPDDTIIGNGAWWADHLTERAKRFMKAAPAAPSTPASGGASVDGPVLFVSHEQLEGLLSKPDPEEGHGRYLPIRRVSAGKFTHPLYASPTIEGESNV